MNFSNPVNLIIAGLYFVIVGFLAIFGIFGIYIFIRYGRSLPLALVISGVFIFFFLTIVFQSYANLNSLLI